MCDKLLKDLDKSLCVRCHDKEMCFDCFDGYGICKDCLDDIADKFFYEVRCAECGKLLGYEEESQRHPQTNIWLSPVRETHITEIFCSKECMKKRIVRNMSEDIENEAKRENIETAI